jgi:hypothetical protein
MKPTLGFINTSLAVILGIGCVACVEQPAGPTSASDVLAVRRAVLSGERATRAVAGRTFDLTASGAAVASGFEQEIPGCKHAIEVDVSADSGEFTASASLSCETVNDYSYVDVVAYATDEARSEVTVLTAAAGEGASTDAIPPVEITGTIKRGQVLLVDSLALTIHLDEFHISFQRAEPSP